MREKLCFDRDWKCHHGEIFRNIPREKGPVYESSKTQRALWGPACVNYSDRSDGYGDPDKEVCTEDWYGVKLPHDYIISQEPKRENNNARGFFNYHNAWYRKTFDLPAEDEGKRISIYFEGVATHADVWVNGCLCKHNFCGYTPFEVDITDVAIIGGQNTVAVYVRADAHEGWWYEGAGIYRHVWLIKTASVSVDLYGVYVHPEKDGDVWNVPVDVTVRNDSVKERKVTVTNDIVSADGTVVATMCGDVCIQPKYKQEISLSAQVSSPDLWDTENPNMYKVVTHITENGEDIDCVCTDFGFRTIEFDADRGFFLNGKRTFIKGMCCHQDYGLTGKAMPDNIHRYRVKLLKEMGANGYRTAHYPHAELTMDALDKAGMLVLDETRWFESSDEGIEQLEMLVKRDRNRPGVIMWSIGNEEPIVKTERGRKIAETLAAVVKRLDKTRPVTCAISHDPATSPANAALDVLGANYNLWQLDDMRKNYPDKPIFSSECCATSSTRGWYINDDSKLGYLYAYDRDTNSWWSGREKTIKFFDERPWIFGFFQWAGIEHRGETVWPRLCSQAGAIDLFLQKKDAFYQNQSHFTDKPMIHILPHWNQQGREGEVIDVWAYTNCDSAELFLNGQSLGVCDIEKFGHAEWKVAYQPGELKAIGYVKGKEVVSDIVKTSGPAYRLCLRLEDEDVYAGRNDVAILTCYCEDEQGNFVPDANPTVSFACNGPGLILATGSDVCDHVPVYSVERKMREGLISVAVQPYENAGRMTVYAKADGLVLGKIEFATKKI